MLPADAQSCSKGIDYSYGRLLDNFRGQFHREKVMAAVELLYQVNTELKQGFSPQFTLEVAMIRLLRIFHHRQQEDIADTSQEGSAVSPSVDMSPGEPGSLPKATAATGGPMH